MTKSYLAIDPGVSGGLAYIAGERIEVLRMKENADVLNWMLDRVDEDSVVGIELVTGYVGKRKGKDGEDVGGDPGSRMFTFGKNVGAMEMAFIACGKFDARVVHSATWQKHHGMTRNKQETKTQWKNRLKVKASCLFPSVDVTLKTADALLLVKYLKDIDELISAATKLTTSPEKTQRF